MRLLIAFILFPLLASAQISEMRGGPRRFPVVAAGGGGASNLGLFGFATNSVASGTSSATLNNVPAGALLVLVTGSENAQDAFAAAQPAATGATLFQVTNTSAAGVGTIVALVSTNASLQNITATSSFTGGAHKGLALYAFTNGVGGPVKVGNVQEAHSTSWAPSESITTSKSGDYIVIGNDDFSAVAGTITYRGSSNTQIMDANYSGSFRLTCWYELQSTVQAYTVGQSAPTGQASGLISLVVTTP